MVVNSLAIFISNHGHQRKTIHFNTLTYLKHSLEMLFNLKSILHKIKAEALSGRPLTMADLICSHAHTNINNYGHLLVIVQILHKHRTMVDFK